MMYKAKVTVLFWEPKKPHKMQRKQHTEFLNVEWLPTLEKYVYLPSLMMKVPNHLYVLGDTYTCHT
jgi:hypothetical protein